MQGSTDTSQWTHNPVHVTTLQEMGFRLPTIRAALELAGGGSSDDVLIRASDLLVAARVAESAPVCAAASHDVSQSFGHSLWRSLSVLRCTPEPSSSVYGQKVVRRIWDAVQTLDNDAVASESILSLVNLLCLSDEDAKAAYEHIEHAGLLEFLNAVIARHRRMWSMQYVRAAGIAVELLESLHRSTHRVVELGEANSTQGIAVELDGHSSPSPRIVELGQSDDRFDDKQGATSSVCRVQ